MSTKCVALDFTPDSFERTLERTRLALLAIMEAEQSDNPIVLAYTADLFEVQEVLQDAYFIRETMVEVYHNDFRERDLPTFLLLLKNIANLTRTLLNYVILAKRFFYGRVFCTYCSALRVILQHPDLEGATFLVPEEYSAQSFHGQQQYEQDHLRVYFEILEEMVEECLSMLEIIQIPPAERPAPPPAASDPSVNGVVLPDEVDGGATSENHAGSEAPDHVLKARLMTPAGATDGGDHGDHTECDTYLDLNLFPPGYEFDCERGRNGASTSRDPALNDTDHDVEVADQENYDNERLIRSMISVGGYCPICGCSGVGYQQTYSTDAANAEGSDEVDGAGSGAEPMDLS